ncbi:MarR family transcriptional regulator [Arthrobacter sp. NPDC055585]|uniref:MarR family winged helix-turn-helix transcriptional regulator n=1 Tax=Arthrobacter koreensis TaxID=199136 RepID=UPI002DBBDE46|nr:MarR family winged helix-turn-helix transcriptional regulator [Arthrobacter koreensis]MEB7504438.1 MarR family winged helix-turn-helix transcriptional regulator [Arthrobacter koreensis]
MQNEGDWEAVRLLSTAARMLRREMDNRLRAMGLTQERVTALKVLRDFGPMRRAELARRLRVTAQTLGTTLVSMRSQGLVYEVGDGAEAPKRAVHISEYGREALGQAIRLEDQSLTAELRPALRQELISLISELEGNRQYGTAGSAGA